MGFICLPASTRNKVYVCLSALRFHVAEFTDVIGSAVAFSRCHATCPLPTGIRTLFRIGLVALAIIVLGEIAVQSGLAQSGTMAPDARPYTTLEGGDIDSISTINAGLQLKIPLWSIKQRGNLSLSFTLRYNSPNYSVIQNCTIPNRPCSLSYTGNPNGVFVSASTDVMMTAISNIVTMSNGNQIVQGFYWQVTTPDSGTHNMVSTGSNLYQAADGTGWAFDSATYTLTSRDGVRYVFQGTPGTVTPYPTIGVLQYVEDTNGNRITLNYTSSTNSGVTYYTFTGWTDTLGRTIPSSVYGMTPAQNGSVPSQTTDYSGCTNPSLVVSAATWTPPGSSAAFKFCFGYTQIKTNFFNGATATQGTNPTEYEMGGQVLGLQSLVLLNGSNLSFQYKPLAGGTYNYGELTQVTLPTGGTLGYTWSENFKGCVQSGNAIAAYSRRSTVDNRILNANDGSGPQTWTYTMPSSTSSGLTVQDPSGSSVRHLNTTISGNCGVYETEADYYDNQSNLLRKDSITYRALTNLDYFYSFDVIAGAALPIYHTTIWANGATRQTATVYDSGFTGTGPQGSAPYSYGNVVTQTESDYGTNGSPGAILKTTQTNYWAFQNSTALNLNLLDRPSSITVTDGLTGTTQTSTYAYDQNGLVSGNASAGWDASPSNGATRGNLTSSSKYWDTSVAYLTTIKTYTDTGLLSTVTEPTNPSISPAAATSYQYSSTYDGTFVTGVTDALGHTASSTYDFTTGHVNTLTDENNIVTQYSYDTILRLTGVTHLGNGHTLASSIGYSYPSPNTHVQTTRLNSALPLETVSTHYDGIGRIRQVQHSDPQGDVYADTTYDGVGRKASQSTPYRSTNDATYGITSYSYDGLGRGIQVKNPDGTTSATAYVGATTQATNESNGSLQSQKLTKVDGLGRLVAICEVSSAAPIVGNDTPTSCGLDIAATGYLTTYVENIRGMTTVRQGTQLRSFVYDSLGHIVDSTNPELGHVHYAYDNDGNLIAKTSPLANVQTSDTVTVQFAYDALHRVQTKSYTGTSGAASVVAATPTATYVYDQRTVAGKSPENPLGRLTSEYTLLAGSIQAESAYSYDPTGAVESHFQCVTTACTSPTYTDVEYDRDGAENLTLLATPLNSVIATYNDAGNVTVVTPGWIPDANHPTTLLTSALYSPNGELSTTILGNGTSETYSYTPRWLTGLQVAGMNQTSAAKGSTGTISVAGTEQSKYVATSSGRATGQVTITGQEGTYKVCIPQGRIIVCNNVPVTGTLAINVNGFVGQVSLGAGDTDALVASRLAAALSVSGSPVSATSSGSVITITSIASGASANYSVSVINGGGDFSGTISGGSLIGGATPTGYTIYDSGTVNATVGSVSASVSFGQTDTPSIIAQKLAAAIASGSSGTLTTSASGGGVYLASVQTGAATNAAISLSVTYDTTDFSASSYSTNTTNMSGGANAVDQNGTVYSYSLSHAPDGQIVQAVDSVNGTWNYTYDAFNRLSSAAEVNGSSVINGLSWDYDRYGNRWNQNVSAGSAPTPQVGYSWINNKATSSVSYDVAGNVLGDRFHHYGYDAENRLVSVDGSIGYIYDAEGRRVGKNDGTVYTVTTSGQVLDEVKGATWKRSEVYIGAKHLATVNATGVVFVHGDWIGTERGRTNMTGVLCESVTSLPFGDNMLPAGSCNVSPDFLTGKPRDAESGLDDFGARYLSSQWGRWMSADWTAGASSVPYATLTNPQSLNLYAYVGNDPIDGMDPDGHARSSPYVSRAAEDAFDGFGEPDGARTMDADALARMQQNASPTSNKSKDSTTPASGPPQLAQQQSAAPLKDKSGNVVQGANGKPALIPGGFDLNGVVQTGKSDKELRGNAPMVGTTQTAEDLANCRRGGKWDLQRLSGNFDPRFIDSATILIGMYAGAAGITRNQILDIENTIAITSSYPKGTKFDSTYTHLPVRNVTNTDIGMGLVQ